MERVKSFELKGNEYSVEFPNIGQLIDIETRKAMLSKGQYGGILESFLLSGLNALECVDAIAFFDVCCPKIKEDLKVKSYLDLDPMDFLQIYSVYQEEILPWITPWLEEFNKAFDTFRKNKKKKD